MPETISQRVYERIEVMIARYAEARGIERKLAELREEAAKVKAEYEHLASEVAKLQNFERDAFETLKVVASVIPDPDEMYLLSTLEGRFGPVGPRAKPGDPVLRRKRGRPRKPVVPDRDLIRTVLSPDKPMTLSQICTALGYAGPLAPLRTELRRVRGLIARGAGYSVREDM